MQDVLVVSIEITGSKMGTDKASFLDPVAVFKGKLRATATRNKLHDFADLRWLKERYAAAIRQKVSELNLEYVGRALRNYPELEPLFNDLGIDLNAAKARVANIDTALPVPEPGDVQKGILSKG